MALEYAQSVLYTFSTSLIEPPTGSQVRFDAGPPYDTVTKIWLRYLSADGIDGFYALSRFEINYEYFLQDQNDHTRYAAFRQMGPSLDKTDYFELPVAWIGNGGLAFANNQDVLIGIFRPTIEPEQSTEPDTGEPTGPLDFTHDGIVVSAQLVSLAECKAHLRITSTAHDADITAKSEVAQAAILAKLAYASDATWTASTVPKPIKHCILMLTTHYYEHRGDDMSPSMSGATPDRDVWAAIDQLLSFYRDPTLA